MLLYDIIELDDSIDEADYKAEHPEIINALALKEAITDFNKGLELIEQVDATRGVVQSSRALDKSGVFAFNKHILKEVDDLRVTILTESGNLPATLQYPGTDDFLTKIGNTPKIALSAVRNLADKLGFVVMPFSYLNDDCIFKDQKKETIEAIFGFVKALEQLYDIYVLSPLVFYDIEKHVRAKEDFRIYAGLSCSQAFMAINMAMPLFREIVGQISRFKDMVSSIDERLKEMTQRLNNLQRQVEKQQYEIYMQQQQIQKMQSEISFAHDPMMLAIPKKIDISVSECSALVGPSWGPDFDDIVATSMGITKIAGQKEKLTALMQSWRNTDGNFLNKIGPNKISDLYDCRFSSIPHP